jgi:hypothetical protein
VFRKLGLLAGLAGVLTPWAAVQSQSAPDAQASNAAKSQAQTQASAQPQEQPSLADAARQARQNKDKGATPAKRVFTDEDMASGHSNSNSSSVGGLTSGHSSSTRLGGHSPSRVNATDNTPMGQAWAGIGRAEDSLDQLAPLDRASLARVVLEGNDVDFPGRRAWENRLYVAKETYVAESRQLVDEMKSLMENAQSFQDPSGAAKGGSDSPQAQELVGRAQRLLLQAKTTEANFKAVMQEGQDQAKLVSRH